MPTLDAVFALLFKYRRAVFEAGEVTLATAPSAPLVAAGVAVASLILSWSYRRQAVSALLRRRDLLLLAGLRLTTVLLVGFCLLEPKLRVMTVAPQQSFVGVLLDDSQSLAIQDDRGQPRGAFAQAAMLDEAGELRRALERRFKLRIFRFSDLTERVQGKARLSFRGTRTDLAQAFRHVREELADVPVAGLVVLTDGADNVASPLSETLLDLRTQQVPVFTVGLGREAFQRDVEITRVETPAAVLQGSSVVASVTLKTSGVGREPLLLSVEDAGRILSSQEIPPFASESSTVRLTLRTEEAGPRLLRFKVKPLQGEQLTENNVFDVALDVLGRKEKVLYFEGGARFEAKFLRRAAQGDQNLQVVTLERTAKDKFLRLDVDDAEELAAGFPHSREELFKYRGLIIGAVEASFFGIDQMRMLTDFVSQRGGGLLMLGSDQTFAEGGYSGTSVAEALPVVFDPEAATAPAQDRSKGKDGAGAFQLLKVEVTPLGAAQPVTQLAANESENEKRFRALPALSAVNVLTRVKPGASLLLSGAPVDRPSERQRVVLASQRYGRGRTFALPVQDSWRWQMHADVAAGDPSHETFWRQLLRQLVSGVSGPVAASLSSGLVSPRSPVAIRADVSDETFIRVNDAVVTATIKKSNGDIEDLRLPWTVDKDGEYQAEVRGEGPGIYEVRVAARRGGVLLGEDVTHFRVADVPVEFRGAEMKADLLRRIASETGGRFYTPETVSTLPEDLSYSPKTATLIEEKELWDMPVLFLGILMCLSLEWILRKYRGLA